MSAAAALLFPAPPQSEYSLLTPVSLQPHSWKAQSTLIGQLSQAWVGTTRSASRSVLPVFLHPQACWGQETLLCVNSHFASFWPIVHMDPVNALFWNLVWFGWRVEKNQKMLPSHSRVDSESAYFEYRWRHRPTLRPHNPTTSHNHNNENGGLHACVCAAEDIEPIRVSRVKYSAPLPLHWAKKDYGQPTSHFRLLLLVFGFSFYCLFVYSAQALCMLCLFFSDFSEFQAPAMGLEHKLHRVESFTMDPFGRKYSWKDAEENEGKKIVLVRVDVAWGCYCLFPTLKHSRHSLWHKLRAFLYD